MTGAPEPTVSELLVRYVRTALERMERGESVQPALLCREHPHLAAPLAEALGLAGDLRAIDPEALRGDPLAGLLLASRYRLETCLGRGAMGVVYRAEDQELRRPVAVKILDARLFADPTAEQRFHLRAGSDDPVEQRAAQRDRFLSRSPGSECSRPRPAAGAAACTEPARQGASGDRAMPPGRAPWGRRGAALRPGRRWYSPLPTRDPQPRS